MRTYSKSSKVKQSLAKKDPRLKEGKRLIGFRFLGIDRSCEPKTLFYEKQIESVG